ncbi:MAG TPA: glycoside hydrolase family 2 protein, partial [Anaerolineaceae bacterium]
ETAIPPLESRQITRLDFDGALEHQSPREVIFAAELRAGGEEAGTLIATFVPNKHLDLRDPRLEMSVRQVDGQLEIRVTAHSAARFIELDFRGTDAVFSDNYFDLPANRSRTIHVSIPQGISAAEAQAQLQMRSLFDSY